MTLHKFVVRLKPITPIHVWSGDDVVICLDAHIHENNLYVLTPEDLNKLRGDEIVKILESSKDGSERMFNTILQSLIRSRQLKPIAEVKIKEHSYLSLCGKRERVRLMHNDIIPGSTLKGYIRTAILRYELVRDPNVANVIKKGVNLYLEPSRVGEGIEASVLRKPRLRRQGGFVDVMELLMISDPEKVDVRLSLRELLTAEAAIPNKVIARTLAVVLDPTNSDALRFTLTINKDGIVRDGIVSAKGFEEILEHRNKFVSKFSGKNYLIDALREFGCNLIDFELKRLHKSLGDYIDLLNYMKRNYCETKTNCVPARIGFMTGREAKTIIDLLMIHTPQLYQNVVSYMQREIKRLWDSLTVKLVDYDCRLLGVGWCELCVE